MLHTNTPAALICCPFTDTMICRASRGPVKMSLSWSRTCGKMAYQYTCSSKRKRVAVASAVIIAIVLYTKAAKKETQSTCMTRQWILDRERQGAFNHLMQEIRMCNTSSYRNFVRMNAVTFEQLHCLVDTLQLRCHLRRLRSTMAMMTADAMATRIVPVASAVIIPIVLRRRQRR